MRSSIFGLLMVGLVLGLSAATITGCGKENPSFSLLAESNTFNQGFSVDTKIDVLFVVDNSGSMAPAQANLVANFNAFISSFVTKGYDFRIGVITTDVWRANYGWGAAYARLKDGYGANQANHTGVFVITPATPNVQSVFLTNATPGITGDGDERTFQSFKIALSSSLNSDFRRPNAFLAIINVSDEDDFSHDGSGDINENYNNAGIHTIASYVSYLDTLTGTSGSTRRYSFSSIHVLDNPCLAQSNSAANIGIRYSQLVAATNGVEGSICAPNFSTELDKIQQKILVLANQFFLPREPVPESIQVIVNGVIIPEDANTGWTYNASSNSIVFSFSAVPPQGASIIVNYDPVTVL